jgi:hypothetical protein
VWKYCFAKLQEEGIALWWDIEMLGEILTSLSCIELGIESSGCSGSILFWLKTIFNMRGETGSDESKLKYLEKAALVIKEVERGAFRNKYWVQRSLLVVYTRQIPLYTDPVLALEKFNQSLQCCCEYKGLASETENITDCAFAHLKYAQFLFTKAEYQETRSHLDTALKYLKEAKSLSEFGYDLEINFNIAAIYATKFRLIPFHVYEEEQQNMEGEGRAEKYERNARESLQILINSEKSELRPHFFKVWFFEPLKSRPWFQSMLEQLEASQNSSASLMRV